MFTSEDKSPNKFGMDAAYTANRNFDRAYEADEAIQNLVKDLKQLTADEIVSLAEKITTLRHRRDSNKSLFQYDTDMAYEWFSLKNQTENATSSDRLAVANAMQQRQAHFLANPNNCGSNSLNNLNS